MNSIFLLMLAKGRTFAPYVPPEPGVPATVTAISSPTATEGGTLVFSVTLDGASLIASPLSYGVAGTAAPADIGTPVFSNGVTLAGATLTVPAGVAAFTVSVPTVADLTLESTESVVLTIDGITGIGMVSDGAMPANALTFMGDPLTFMGEYLTFG